MRLVSTPIGERERSVTRCKKKKNGNWQDWYRFKKLWKSYIEKQCRNIDEFRWFKREQAVIQRKRRYYFPGAAPVSGINQNWDKTKFRTYSISAQYLPPLSSSIQNIPCMLFTNIYVSCGGGTYLERVFLNCKVLFVVNRGLHIQNAHSQLWIWYHPLRKKERFGGQGTGLGFSRSEFRFFWFCPDFLCDLQQIT